MKKPKKDEIVCAMYNHHHILDAHERELSQ